MASQLRRCRGFLRKSPSDSPGVTPAFQCIPLQILQRPSTRDAIKSITYADPELAQCPYKANVGGSIPSPPTNFFRAALSWDGRVETCHPSSADYWQSNTIPVCSPHGLLGVLGVPAGGTVCEISRKFLTFNVPVPSTSLYACPGLTVKPLLFPEMLRWKN